MSRRRRYLSDLVEAYFAPEPVTRRCNSAKCHGREYQRHQETIITGGSEILAIQIMRMGFNRKTERHFKIMDCVAINKLLDLSPYTISRTGAGPAPVAGDDLNNSKPLRYQLQGVVSHLGWSLTGGHYVATVRCRNGVDFVRLDDDRDVVNLATNNTDEFLRVDDKTVQSYIAFYQKVGGKMANCI